MEINLRDFISAFPRSESKTHTEEHRAVTGNAAPVDGYVWPDARITSSSSLGSILLVSAPGAMGKTQAAKAIANYLNAIYVDLAKINVGNGSLVGELFKALGAKNSEDLKNSLRAKRATLVLDSTDEAQLRSGSDNFFEFLKDLDWFIDRTATEGAPNLILLGRSDSLQMTEVALKLLNFESTVAELQPLSQDQATEFINVRLDITRYRLHRTQPVPFGALRDAVLIDLARALTTTAPDSFDLRGDWSDVDHFLGYPPVLIALAERLRAPNPQQELTALAATAASKGRKRRGQLLQTVVEQILDRESDKVRDSLGESLGIRPDSDEGQSLYDRNEQSIRLLALTGTSIPHVDYPALLPDADRDKYDELIRSFVSDHPFIRGESFASPVFSDYLRSWALTATLSGFLNSDRTELLETLPPVGPFFATFTAELSATVGNPQIPEDLVDQAIKSHSAGSPSARAWYSHQSESNAHLRLLDEDPRLAEEYIDFEVIDADGVLKLNSPLSQVAVFSRHGVILRGNSSGAFDLGPEVMVIASDLEIQTSALRVIGSSQAGDQSYLISTSNASHPGDIRVTIYNPGTLIVSWPHIQHAWKAYQIPILENSNLPITRPHLAQVVVATRKLLVAFHRTSRDAPAVSADKVERVLIGSNDVAIAVKAAFEELGIIELRGSQYQLILSRLGEMGVSYQDITATDPFSALSNLCTQIVSTTAFQRHLTENQ